MKQFLLIFGLLMSLAAKGQFSQPSFSEWPVSVKELRKQWEKKKAAPSIIVKKDVPLSQSAVSSLEEETNKQDISQIFLEYSKAAKDILIEYDKAVKEKNNIQKRLEENKTELIRLAAFAAQYKNKLAETKNLEQRMKKVDLQIVEYEKLLRM